MTTDFITIAVTGSRKMTNRKLVIDIIENILDRKYSQSYIHIIVGDAAGVDNIVYEWAKNGGVSFTTQLKPANRYFPRLWKSKKDNVLYLARNMQVVDNSDILIAIWDGESSGTKNTIDYAKSVGKNVIIERVDI